QPPMNNQPISDADSPSVEAIERSMLPLTIMNTIGNIMIPISIKSDVVRSRLSPFKKNGDSRVLTIVTTTISATRSHSQRRNVRRSEFAVGVIFDHLSSIYDFGFTIYD